MSEQRPSPSHPTQGPIGRLLSLLGRIIGLVIGALVLRVMLELAGLYFWWPQEGSRHVFQVMRRERVELVIALQSHPSGDEILVLLEKGATHVLMANRLLQKPFTALVYTLVSFMQRLVWLVANAPPALPVCGNRADGGTGAAGSEAIWLRAGIRFSPPLCHQVRQFSRHHAVGVLSGTAAVSACDAGFTACRLMVWDNSQDGGREF